MEHHGRRILAENPVGRIEQCDCGMLHLTVGALTLRLTPALIQQLTHLLGGASAMTAFGRHHHAPLA